MALVHPTLEECGLAGLRSELHISLVSIFLTIFTIITIPTLIVSMIWYLEYAQKDKPFESYNLRALLFTRVPEDTGIIND